MIVPLFVGREKSIRALEGRMEQIVGEMLDATAGNGSNVDIDGVEFSIGSADDSRTRSGVPVLRLRPLATEPLYPSKRG